MPAIPISDRISNLQFRRAVDLIDAGDAPALASHLVEYPELLTMRVKLEDSGYFAEPYLLNFVAGNPIRQDQMPGTIVEVTQVILDAGAAHDQEALDYTLGLVATGCRPREGGVQLPLLKLLLERGANVGESLAAAISHREMEAVAFLRKAKGTLELWEAAALGELDESHLANATQADLRKAMALATLHNQAEALEMLCEAGAEVNVFNPEGFHAHSTPLHQAALANHREAVDVLLTYGARVDIPDTIFGGTAIGWAAHSGHDQLADYLRVRGTNE